MAFSVSGRTLQVAGLLVFWLGAGLLALSVTLALPVLIASLVLLIVGRRAPRR